MKKKAEEDQEKEEGEITDEDSDHENIDDLLAKTRNRFLVVNKRNGNSVGKQNPVKKRSPLDQVSTVESVTEVSSEESAEEVSSVAPVVQVSSKDPAVKVSSEDPAVDVSTPNINNIKTATWKMVDGKVELLSHTR